MRQADDNYEFSHTELSTFKQCKRKWYLGYYLRLKRKKNVMSVARGTGIVVHEALEQYYSLGQNEFARKQAFEYLLTARDEDMAKLQDVQSLNDAKAYHDLAWVITSGYFDWLDETHADDEYDFTNGSEEKLIVPGPLEGTTLKGYLDLHGTHRATGDLVVLDNKVVADINTPLKTINLNEQAPTYAILSKLNQDDNKRGFRVIWNFLKKSKRTARAKPPFYQRYTLPLNPDMLPIFWSQLHGTMMDILQAEKRLNDGESHQIVAYPTPTPDCSWKCEFFSVCPLMNDPRSDPDWLLQTYYEVKGSSKDADTDEEIVVE